MLTNRLRPGGKDEAAHPFFQGIQPTSSDAARLRLVRLVALLTPTLLQERLQLLLTRATGLGVLTALLLSDWLLLLLLLAQADA